MPVARKPKPKSQPRSSPKSPPKPKSAAAGSKTAPQPRLTLADAMRELERAGSAQTRKTYARHGVTGPMFGVSFATMKVLMKRIGVDHDLALALWDTGNFDARNLAVKVVDPARMTPADLDRWARESSAARLCGGYVAMIAAEGPHAAAKASQWLAAEPGPVRGAGWALLGQLAQRDEKTTDAVFEQRLAEIERTIHTAPNEDREGMNMAVIVIGGRNNNLRKQALAAAKRIGKVDVDHGDTSCKTPDAATYIEKAWAHAKAKGFESPAAQERARESQRLRC